MAKNKVHEQKLKVLHYEFTNTILRCLNLEFRTGERTQPIIIYKSNDLSSSPENHMIERENDSCDLSSDFHSYTVTCAHVSAYVYMDVHTHTH